MDAKGGSWGAIQAAYNLATPEGNFDKVIVWVSFSVALAENLGI